jgi:hypothetical protein
MNPTDNSFYTEGNLDSRERGSGARANGGKVSFALVPFHLFSGVARVFMGGKLKYAEWNWAKGMGWSVVVDCVFRHLFKWWYMGEDLDPESGEHHIDHIICNLLMLKHYTRAYPDGDDRPPQDMTGFNEWLSDMATQFDEDAYLERNPDIKAIVEKHRREQREQAGAA